MNRTTAVRAGLAGILALALAPAFRPAPMTGCEPTPISSLPATITESGVYCLTDNLTAVAGSHGIDVNAQHVTIDLNGFALQGVPGSLNGIETSNITGLRVRNGWVRDFDGLGVSAGDSALLTDVRLSGNGSGGVAAGRGSILDACSAVGNGGTVIDLGPASIVRDTFVRTNDDAAEVIRVGADSLVESTRVEGGEVGILTGVRCTVRGCSVIGFAGTGVWAGSRSAVEGTTTATPSTATTVGIRTETFGKVEGCGVTGSDVGMIVEDGGRIAECSVDDASTGISTGAGSRVVDTVVKNASSFGVLAGPGAFVGGCTIDSGTGTGIEANEGATVERCIVRGLGESGIRLGDRGTVSGCSALGNGDDGIAVASEGVAWGNTASGNGDAGVRVAGNRCRVEGNTLDSNRIGLLVEGSHTLSTGNRAANNTQADFSLPAGNPSGPMLKSTWWLQGSIPHANFRTPGF